MTKTPVTHGSVVRQRQLRGAVVTEAAYLPGFRVERHAHDRASLMWVMGGQLVEAVEAHRYLCSVADVMWKQAGLPHENSLEGASARVVVVELLPSVLDTLNEAGTGLPDAPVRVSGTPAALFARLLPLMTEAGPGDVLAVQELVAAVLSAVAARIAEPSGVPGWLTVVRERLHEEPWECNSLGVMARDAGVHPAHLSRMFRRCFGRTMTEYLHARRIDLAVAALATGEADIGRLALRLGYYDHAHFSRMFRRATGIPPSRYRAIATDPSRSEW